MQQAPLSSASSSLPVHINISEMLVTNRPSSLLWFCAFSSLSFLILSLCVGFFVYATAESGSMAADHLLPHEPDKHPLLKLLRLLWLPTFLPVKRLLLSPSACSWVKCWVSAIYEKPPEITSVMIWRYMNKIELNLIECITNCFYYVYFIF